MAKDPAFLFYTGDFSTGTQFFSNEQLGKYLRLLMAQHQHGHLPERHMNFICGSYDADIFAKFTKDADGLFYNERLELEINRRKKYVSSRSNNLKAKPVKDKKVKPIRNPYDNHMDNHMENENKDENEDINKKEILIFPYESSEFMEVWNTLIKTKKWRKKEFSALQSSLKFLSGRDEKEAIAIMERSIAGEWQGLFELDKKQQNGKSVNKGFSVEQAKDFMRNA